MEFKVVDVSYETYGKYQYCTEYKGLWYADSDFGSDGKPKRGSMPAPHQSSIEKTEMVKRMYEDKALEDVRRLLKIEPYETSDDEDRKFLVCLWALLTLTGAILGFHVFGIF